MSFRFDQPADLAVTAGGTVAEARHGGGKVVEADVRHVGEVEEDFL